MPCFLQRRFGLVMAMSVALALLASPVRTHLCLIQAATLPACSISRWVSGSGCSGIGRSLRAASATARRNAFCLLLLLAIVYSLWGRDSLQLCLKPPLVLVTFEAAGAAEKRDELAPSDVEHGLSP